MRWSKALVLGLALVIALAARADLPAPAQQEIDHLIRYIGDSGCAFERNGTWSNGKAAESHVRGKYDFLVKLGMIDTTQDFIDEAATQSSLSGQPYEVRCADDSAMPSSLWLNSELARYRASRHSSPGGRVFSSIVLKIRDHLHDDWIIG